MSRFTPVNVRGSVLGLLVLGVLACGDRVGESSASNEPLAPISEPSPPSSPPPSLALVGGLLIDGRGGEPVRDATVVLRDGVVAAVGPRSAVSTPEGAEIVELAGAAVLPGLINAHVHNAYQTGNLQRWAMAGVTTVRDVGAQEPAAAAFRFRDAARVDPRLARIVSAGPLVTVPGGYPLVPNNFPAWTVLGPEDARFRIDELIDLGADLVKITLESGGGRLPVLSEAEVVAIVETAHRRDHPVIAHVTAAEFVALTLRTGVDEVDHLPLAPLSGDLIAGMVVNRMDVVPTLEANGGGDENLRRLVAAGIRVALGTDAGYLPGLEIGTPISELERMQRAGMTPMQVLVAATAEAARVCRIDSTVGTLEAGMAADLLVVDGDPLSDLRVLTRIRMVIHGGHPILRRH